MASNVVTLRPESRSPLTARARLRRARCAANLTQAAAGALVCKDARYVRRLENGEVPLTQIELLDALEARALARRAA